MAPENVSDLDDIFRLLQHHEPACRRLCLSASEPIKLACGVVPEVLPSWIRKRASRYLYAPRYYLFVYPARHSLGVLQYLVPTSPWAFPTTGDSCLAETLPLVRTPFLLEVFVDRGNNYFARNLERVIGVAHVVLHLRYAVE